MTRALLLSLASLACLQAHAALLPRLGGAAYYDTVADVMWLADANLAATQKFGIAAIDADGKMQPFIAADWLTSMNANRWLGFSDWRAPALRNDRLLATGSCRPLTVFLFDACTTYEFGELYYGELGAILPHLENGELVASDLRGDTPPFSHIQNEYMMYDTVANGVSGFNFASGEHDGFGTDRGRGYVWAVRDGDVYLAAPSGPPLCLALLGALLFRGNHGRQKAARGARVKSD